MVDLPITKWIKKKIRRLIGIVEDTDVATHSIASGKYVVWKGDLYKSTAAIAVGGSLSLSNLSPVSDGGLNELSEQIGNKQNKIIITSQTYTISDSNFGFIDSGISSESYFMLAAYTLIRSNDRIAISNLAGGNYRFQVVSSTDGSIYKTGNVEIWFAYIGFN